MQLEDIVIRLERAEKRIQQLTAVLDDILAKNLPVDFVLDKIDQRKEVTAQPLIIEFDDRFEHPNFYKSEIINGASFRWMGPEPETSFLLNRSLDVPYELVLDIPHAAHGGGVLQDLKILVDGKRIDHRLEQVVEGFKVSAAIEPVDAEMMLPVFVLQLQFPSAIRLDERVGTIALTRLTLTPAT